MIISDFLINAGEVENAIERLSAARHEVKVVHVLGEQESTGAYPPGLYRVRDVESGEIRETILGPEMAALCRRRVEQISARIREICTRRGVSYAQAFGAGNLEQFIERELPLFGVVR